MSVLMSLISDNQSVRYEASLLLNIFLENSDDIQSLEVQRILDKNQSKLLAAIKDVDFESFDKECHNGVCLDQLSVLIRRIPPVSPLV